MRKRRIFIAINLPQNIKEALLEWAKGKEKTYPFVRWTKKDNLHLTILFLGYLSDDEVKDVIEAVQRVGKDFGSFPIRFGRIIYGPPNRTPRMIWVEGENHRQLAVLKNELEKELISRRVRFRQENRPLKIHITLGRFPKPISLSQLPSLDEKIDYQFEAKSIEVMESELKRGGAEYTILASQKFKI